MDEPESEDDLSDLSDLSDEEEEFSDDEPMHGSDVIYPGDACDDAARKCATCHDGILWCDSAFTGGYNYEYRRVVYVPEDRFAVYCTDIDLNTWKGDNVVVSWYNTVEEVLQVCKDSRNIDKLAVWAKNVTDRCPVY